MLKKILPWLVAVGIFAYLFHIYPISKIWSALQYVQLAYFIPFAIGYFFLIYFSDIFAMTQFLKRFGFNISMRDLFPARGVTYLIMILNYGAGQAGFAYYLKKKHRIPLWEAFSLFFFIMVIDLYWILSLALAGSFFQEYSFGGIEFKKIIWALTSVAYLLFILNLFFWRGPIYKKLQNSKSKIIQWILKKDIFRLFKEARPWDYLKLAILRTPIHISLILSMYFLLKIFGVDVKFLPLLGNMPLIILIGTIPITPGGLGTTNAAMVHLLSPYLGGPLFHRTTVTPQEILLAASLLWMFTNYLMKAVFGAICLNRVSKDLFQGPLVSKPGATLNPV